MAKLRDLCKKNCAKLGFLALALATTFGFLQSGYDRESRSYGQCLATNERIVQIKQAEIESQEALLSAAARTQPPERQAQQAEVIAAYREDLRNRLDKLLPPSNCDAKRPTFWPWEDL